MSEIKYFHLSASVEPLVRENADICIVGAGAIGIYLATRLADKGFTVILLEAGNAPNLDPVVAGFVANFKQNPYPGATVGRAMGLGGSTTRWGGLLIPHTQHDVRPTREQASNSTWELIVKTGEEYADRVLEQLGYHETGGFIEFPQNKLKSVHRQYTTAGLDILASLFLPFSKKNLSFLLHKRVHRRASIRVYTGAVAKKWTLDRGQGGEAHIKELEAHATSGKILQVSAQRFVIAAGAIESSRLLLELQASSPISPLRSKAAIGCFLADHLSVTVAKVSPTSQAIIREQFAPRFCGSWMRSFRFLERNSPVNTPRAFLHFIFENDDSGFLVAKEVLTALQGRRRPRLSVAQALSGIRGLFALADSRYRRARLHIAPDTRIHLQLDIEQEPKRTNCIMLGNELDRFQRRIVDIHWSISEIDIQLIQSTALRALRKWPHAVDGTPILIPVEELTTGPKPHDAYHPVGVCRMGTDVEAVVDTNLRVWGITNLWVATTGVLPSAGTANPTFSILCLAERLVDQFSEKRQ